MNDCGKLWSMEQGKKRTRPDVPPPPAYGPPPPYEEREGDSALRSSTQLCPWCGRIIAPDVKTGYSAEAHFLACLLLLSIICTLCFWLPYCTKRWRENVYFCPLCHNVITAINDSTGTRRWPPLRSQV